MTKYMVFAACMFLLIPNVGAQVDARYVFSGDNVTGPPGAEVEFKMTLDILAGAAGEPRPVSAYEYATRHDAGVATVVAIDRGTLNPSFWSTSILADGYTVSAIFDATSPITQGLGHITEVVQYQLVGADGRSTAVRFTAAPVVVLTTSSTVGVGREGIIKIDGSADSSFVRGDCNDSGMFDIGDGIFLLGMLFQSPGTPHCDAACDANGDNLINIADAIFGFGSLFAGEGPLPAPYPGCGTDPVTEPGDLGCALSASCL